MFKNLFDSLTNTFILEKDVEDFVKKTDFSQYPLFDFKGHSFNLGYYLNKGLIECNQLKLTKPEDAQRYQDRAIESICRIIRNQVMDIGVIKEKVTKMKAFDEYCFHCGKRHTITINEFGAVSFWSVGKTYKDKIVDEPCIFIPKVITQDVELNTGNLIISDYFRVNNKMSKIVKGTHETPDLNCSQGVVDEFNLYFKSKIIKVQFGSGGLSIVENGGNLYFGHIKESCEKKVKIVGSVSHDLWATCVTEQESLVELLKNNNVLFDTDEFLNNQIDKNIQSKVKVKAGLYTIHYSPHNLVSLIEDEFDKNFDFISFKIMKKV